MALGNGWEVLDEYDGDGLSAEPVDLHGPPPGVDIEHQRVRVRHFVFCKLIIKL